MHEHLHRLRRDAAHGLLLLAADLADEMLDEQRDVIDALAQRRQQDGDDVEPIVEVVAELPFLHHLLEVAVRRGDDAHIDMHRLLAAYAVELLLLEHAQQLDLHVLVHLRDLIEEDRAVVRELELAELALHSPRERPLLVAEELGLQEGGRDRTAVHADEGAAATGARVVDALRDDLLARAALPADQHRRGARRRLRGEREHVDDLAALADVAAERRGRLLRAQEFLLEVLGARGHLREPLHEVLDLRDVLDDRDDARDLTVDEDGVDVRDDRRAVLLVADDADARDARAQHADAVAVRRMREDVLPEHHLHRLVDDAQIRRIHIGDEAALVHDADAVLHRLEDHLQPLLHECVLVQQLVHLVELLRLMHLEVALEERGHLLRGPLLIAALRGHEHRVAAARLERDELHDAAHEEPLAARAAQVELRMILFTELPRALDDHRRDARMDAALIRDHGLPFHRHGVLPFALISSLLYNKSAENAPLSSDFFAPRRNPLIAPHRAAQ